MKSETRLNKIMSMEDSDIKLSKIWFFCARYSLSGSPIWKTAHAEYIRLWDLGFRLYRV